MRDYFYSLAEAIDKMVEDGEVYTCFFEAERSDFVRLNQTRFRQAGRVVQRQISLDLIAGRHHAAGTLTLTGDLSADGSAVAELMQLLRMQRTVLPADPYLCFAREPRCTEHVANDALPDAGDALADIMEAAAGSDVVGIWASGTLYRGFANSLGQRNWYAQPSFNFDWSCFDKNGQAVKRSYAGTVWEPARLAQKIDSARGQLDRLKKPSWHLKPGRYRAYLAPAAVGEMFELLGWGGFGLKSHRTLQTPLLKLAHRQVSLHPSITLYEHHASGLAPPFTASGFLKPAAVTLIRGGQYGQCLVSPRSAVEYGESVNAGAERPEALALEPGRMTMDSVLQRLDKGLYISDLWYCNFSDRNACRITGMTRYACFWVEHARIIAPLPAMRFDDSVYRMFGDQLLDLTLEREQLFSPDTYYQRSTHSALLPGALIEAFTLTL